MWMVGLTLFANESSMLVSPSPVPASPSPVPASRFTLEFRDNADVIMKPGLLLSFLACTTTKEKMAYFLYVIQLLFNCFSITCAHVFVRDNSCEIV